jgi:crotonobetainyl-CoA:carnitine CoA-transferase CaiB-like acyl-CoA transferase
LPRPWVSVNAGKRSITMDLKQPKALEIIKRLVPKVDVVMENFRPGVMDKLGLGYETLKAINPEADLLRRLGLRPGRARQRRRRRSTA